MTARAAAAFAAALAGCAAAPPTAPATVDLVGEWASLDTLVYGARVPDPATGEDGETVEVRALRTHLSLGDSTWTETSVSRGLDGLDGFEGTFAYRTAGDTVAVRYGPSAERVGRAAVRGDTLTLTFAAPDGAPVRQRFVRTGPLGVPPELVGFWAGLSAPDAAGVPAEVGFRFRADGTHEDGWGDPLGPFRVLGPYLLLSGLAPALPDGLSGTVFETVAEVRLDPAAEVWGGRTAPALVFGTGADRLVLYRLDR